MFLNILVFLYSLGQVGRVSLFNNQVNFYLYELFLSVALIYLIFKQGKRPLVDAHYKFKGIFLFFGITAFSLFISAFNFSQFENLVALLYLTRLSLYLLLFIYSKKYFKNYGKPLFLLAGFLISFSIIQYFFYPNLRNLYYLGWDPHQYRVFGTFLEPATLSAVLGLLLLNFFFQKFKFRNILLIILGTLGVLTFSRGFYLAFLVSFLILLLKNGLYKQLLLLIVGFVLILTAAPKPFGEGVNLLRTSTLESRKVDYQEGIEIWKKNPFLGIGYNHLPFVEKTEKKKIPDLADSAFHSSFLTILATTGILGLGAFLFMLYQFTKISPGAYYYTLFLSIYSLTDNIILHPFVLFLYFYLLLREINLSRT